MTDEPTYSGTRMLTQDELTNLSQPLYEKVQSLLSQYSNGDEDLLWALRRKLVKQPTIVEKGRPFDRKMLKARKWGEQNGKCSVCEGLLPEKNSVLDCLDGMNPTHLRTRD